MRTIPIWRFLTILSVLSCDGATEPKWVRTIGVVDDELATSGAITAPSTASVGVSFSVTATTIGSSDCTRPAGATVAADGLLATVTPYDWVPAGERACFRNRMGYPRTAQITLTEPGTATIRLHARAPDGAPLVLERTVTVVP